MSEPITIEPPITRRIVEPKFLWAAERFKNYGWMQTYTGKKFCLAAPDPADVEIIDIAVALARTARFNGHTKSFYSVAQHSVLASRYADSVGQPLVALLHDAAEAYIGDIVRPLKLGLGDALEEIEYAVLAAIWQRFGLLPGIPGEVKGIDNRLLATEQRDLMPDQLEWGDLATRFPPYPETIEPWSIHESLIRFLQRFELLTSGHVDWAKVPHE